MDKEIKWLNWSENCDNVQLSPNTWVHVKVETPWFLSPDGTLVVSRNGVMRDFTDAKEQPWYSVRDQIKSVIIEEGVTTIGDYAFDGCISLVSVTIPNSVTRIGERAFAYCVRLTSIVIPDSVTTIGNRAFYNCISLFLIVFPDSVTTVGYDVFKNYNIVR